jgi:ligand-binding sensor domain-containing protein
MNYLKYQYILLYVFFNVFVTFGQNFERISNKEGFNQNTINDIEQDEYGFLWFGTPNGLIKYDGYNFKTYTTQSNFEQSLNSNFISELHNDKNGILWIGTNLGVNFYIHSVEKFIKIPLKEKVWITKIAQDSIGNIWFSGDNQLYVCKIIDRKKGVIEVSKNLLSTNFKNNKILDFSFKDPNTIILATQNGLKKVVLGIEASTNTSKVNLISDFNTFKDKHIKNILKVKDFFWIGTEEGIYKVAIDDKNVHVIKDFNQLKGNSLFKSTIHVDDILIDNYGIIWIATKENGLFKYDEKNEVFQQFKYDSKNSKGISSHQINALHNDDFDVLWIGTAQGGINKLDINQKKFINYTHNPYDAKSLSGNLINAIIEDKKGRLWLSGYNAPLFRSTTTVNEKTVNNLKFEDLTNRIPLAKNDFVRCLFEDSKGFIWIGSDFSLSVYNPFTEKIKKINLKYKNSPYSKISIRAIIETDENEILFAGNKIFTIKSPWKELKGDNELHIKAIFDLELNRAKTILKDAENVFWFGTSEGLLKINYTGDKFNIIDHYANNKKEYKVSYDNIFSLHKNKDTLWVGTFGGGLNKISFNKKSEPINIECFNKNNILPDDAIYGILKSNDSILWLSTDMGLVKFNTNNKDVHVYDVRDGLSQNNFRQGAYFKGNSEYFYFGGLNGLTVFNPEEILVNKQAPQVLISGLFVNNKTIKIGEKFNDKVVLEKSISETNEFSISEKAQVISFNVVAKLTSTPSKNKLAYRLEGFNDSWIQTEVGKEVISYTNLSSGSYKFEIKAGNGDGVWGKSKTLNFNVLPPWYKTIWSYILFSVIVVSTIIYVMYYFLRHQKLKEKLKYEELDKKRIETVNQGKFRYFTNLSHEFRTPLTLIAGPLERVMEQNSDITNNK